MTTTSIVEQAAIHAAVCRARRAGLLCGTCTELAERAARVAVALQIAEAA